ncbi:MAG: hypothetical protein OXN97_04675 [Bryobacterales bacterium]|nr:hypothetical protein [Bryobacterales bacterium]
MNEKQALIAFCREVFRTRNLIGTDIEDVKLEAVERAFVQDNNGVRVQFTVSRHFLGKAMNQDLIDAMSVLLPED